MVPLTLMSVVFMALSVAAFAMEAVAFVHCLTRPARAFRSAGKLPKGTWLLLTGVGAFIGLGGISASRGGVPFGGIFSLAAMIAAIVYFVDVRPAVRGARPPRPPDQGTW